MGYEGHTEINPELILCITLLLIIMGQFQDEWATKGHTHRNEPGFMLFTWDNLR